MIVADVMDILNAHFQNTAGSNKKTTACNCSNWRRVAIVKVYYLIKIADFYFCRKLTIIINAFLLLLN